MGLSTVLRITKSGAIIRHAFQNHHEFRPKLVLSALLVRIVCLWRDYFQLPSNYALPASRIAAHASETSQTLYSTGPQILKIIHGSKHDVLAFRARNEQL